MGDVSTESQRPKKEPCRGVNGGIGIGKCRGEDVVEEVGVRREWDDEAATAVCLARQAMETLAERRPGLQPFAPV